MTLVTQDATSLKYVPVTSAEVTAWLAGTGVAAPVEGWTMQGASSPLADFIGSDPLVDSFSNELFQQAVTGWTRKGILSTPEGGAHCLGTTNNVTVSGTALMLHSLASLPSANRVIGYFLGACTVVDSSGHIGMSDGSTTTFNFGSVGMGTTVHPVFIRVNSVGPTAKVTTDQESVSAPAFSFDAANKLFFGNIGFGIGGAAENYLFGLRWSSLLSDPDVTAVLSRLNTGAVVSVALTPPSPVITTLTTVQLTAIATFQDGSTLDVTSNANTVWTSGTPGVATVNATGLVTGVTNGTTNVTAAFGGVTSANDLVTVGVAVTALAVSPYPFIISVGGTQQLQAIATLSGGGTSDVTSTAVWTTSDATVATVSSTGLVTGVAYGKANIFATYSIVSFTVARVNSQAPGLLTHIQSTLPRWLWKGKTAVLEWMYAYRDIFSDAQVQGQYWLDITYLDTATGSALDQHAKDRGTNRRLNESDAALRQRLKNITDTVTEPALKSSVDAILAANSLGQSFWVVLRRDSAHASRHDAMLSRGMRLGAKFYSGIDIITGAPGTPMIYIVILPTGTPAAVQKAITEYLRQYGPAGFSYMIEVSP